MNRVKVFVIIALLLSGVGIAMGITALAASEKEVESSSIGGPFVTVVKMAGKELTISAPEISSYAIITLFVKNSGHSPIDIAEITITSWKQGPEAQAGENKFSNQAQVKDLAPGEVQTILWYGESVIPGGFEKASLQVEVTNIK